MATLLYVDDEVVIGQVVGRWFRRRGHTVHLAPSIDEAKRVLTSESPDALFIDVWLGSESGFELMDWIADSRPQLADRVTFVTADLAPADPASPVLEHLGRPVIQKPFDFAKLERLVEQVETQESSTNGAKGQPHN